jgi:hypothetical protein
MEREAPCEMLAMKEWESETSPALFSRCSVIDAPMDLPDGDYTVSFNGCVVSARKEAGLWMPAGGTVQMPAAERPRTLPRRRFHVEEAVEILPDLKDNVA